MRNLRSTLPSRIAQMRRGLASAHLASDDGLPIAGRLQTPAQTGEQLQEFLDADAAVEAALIAYRAALAVRQAKEAATTAVYTDAVTYVKARFGREPVPLASFGVAVQPRVKPSAETIAISLAKRAATLAQKKAAQPARAREHLVVYDATGAPIGPPSSPPLVESNSATESYALLRK